jgi:polyphosphate kinase 2 (PPK2 family)
MSRIFAKRTEEMVAAIGEWQLKLYAESKQSLLVILQGMDASGKDGAIKDVFASVNPMGTHVICFKKPTELEYSHDFLWRIHAQVPPAGMIHIFNRSHYEDILVPSVEKFLPESVIKKRFQQINDFEKNAGRRWYQGFEIYVACVEGRTKRKVAGTHDQSEKILEA